MAKKSDSNFHNKKHSSTYHIGSKHTEAHTLKNESCAQLLNYLLASLPAALSVAKIAGELGGVDWKTLAGWLDVQQGKVDGIQAKCLRDGGELAECYRINLVRTFCESEGVTAEVAGEKIANALQKMGKNLQASNIRQLELGM